MCAHLDRVALIVNQNVVPDPVYVGFLCTSPVSLGADPHPYLVEEFRPVFRGHPQDPPCNGISPWMGVGNRLVALFCLNKETAASRS